MSYRVAMDIGGTFTDFVVVDEAARATSTGKTSTTPANPEQGVLADNARALSSYYDLLLKDAFGNFRQLIEDVSAVRPRLNIEHCFA